MYIKNILKNKQNNKSKKKNKPQNKTDKQGEGGCRGTMIDTPPPPNQKIQTQRENKRTLSLIQAVFPLFSSNNDLWE